MCAYLLNADKTYRVTARLGEATDTADADGKVIETVPVPALDFDAWMSVISGFRGEIEQVPPMYSALKRDGKRLYELARQGITVERQPRKVRIHEIELMEATRNRLVMRVHCSKGTYIRTLVEDIAKAAGTVAHAASLHRENVGDFKADDMLDLPTAAAIAAEGPEALRDRLLPADIALASWPEVAISKDSASRFVSGQSVTVPKAAGGLVRVYDSQGFFLGVGAIGSDKLLAPKRIFRGNE